MPRVRLSEGSGPRSYEVESGWRAYQALFPAELRLRDAICCEERRLWRGLDIHLDRYPADGALKVIVAHGAGGYSRLLSPLAVALQRLGYEVIAPDFPGYGLSGAPRRGNTWRLWVDMLAELVAWERERDGRPVVLFGASIGGALAFHAAAHAEVAGLIATMLLDPREAESRRVLGPRWAPPYATELMLRAPRFTDEVRVPIALVSNLSAIANDDALVRLCRRDRRGGGNRVAIGFLKSFLAAVPPIEPGNFDRCPVLLVHPEKDRWTPVEHSRRVFDQLPGAKEFVLLENCGHFPLEEPGLSQMRSAIEHFLARIVPAGVVGSKAPQSY